MIGGISHTTWRSLSLSPCCPASERETRSRCSAFPLARASQLTRYPPIYTPSSYRPSYFGLVLQRHHTLVQESKGDARVAPTVSVSHQVRRRACRARGPHARRCLGSLSAKTKLIIPVVRLLSASSKKQGKKKLPEVLVRGSSALNRGLFFSSYEDLLLRGDDPLCFWLLPFFLFLLTNQGGRTSCSRPLLTRGRDNQKGWKRRRFADV